LFEFSCFWCFILKKLIRLHSSLFPMENLNIDLECGGKDLEGRVETKAGVSPPKLDNDLRNAFQMNNK
jgi:hypothetical protein